jgi:multiple sugar transport system permease protein
MTRAERFIPYVFLAPAIVLVLIFRIGPAVAGFREAVYANALNLNEGRTFVGLENFARVLNDPVFCSSFRVTLVFSLVVNPLQTMLALALAIVANQAVRAITFFRSAYLLPVAVSMNVTALVWGLMLDKNSGLVNGILANFGVPRQPFFLAASQSLGSIIAVVSWKGVPFWMIFFLAGLQGISPALLEAAAIDGATRRQTFWHVTLPLLRRVIAFVLISATIANFILFTPIFLLTRGGPQQSTNLVMFEAYRRGFVYGDLGSAAAMTSLLLIIVFVVVSIEYYFTRET